MKPLLVVLPILHIQPAFSLSPKMKHLSLTAPLIALALTQPLPAAWTLIGDEVTVDVDRTIFGSSPYGSPQTVVDPGIEYSAETYTGIAYHQAEVDLGTTQVTVGMTYNSDHPTINSAHTFTFSNLDLLGAPHLQISGLSLLSSNFDIAPTFGDITGSGFTITVPVQDYDTTGFPAVSPPPY